MGFACWLGWSRIAGAGFGGGGWVRIAGLAGRGMEGSAWAFALDQTQAEGVELSHAPA